MDDFQRMAPKGQIWVCGACGKRAEDLYGEVGKNDPWWDESCAMNAVLQPLIGEEPTRHLTRDEQRTLTGALFRSAKRVEPK